jgi:WD40 repeat protein
MQLVRIDVALARARPRSPNAEYFAFLKGESLMSNVRTAFLLLCAIAPASSALGAPEDSQSSATSPDGKRSAVADAKTIHIFDVATGKEIMAIKGHSDMVTVVAFSPDGKLLLSGGKDKTIRLWDTATGKAIFSLRHSAAITEARFSADGKTITSRDKTKKTIKWDAASGKQVSE